jgi:uncharacterized membrane protein YfcA
MEQGSASGCFQAYNLTVLSAALAVKGLLTWGEGCLLLWALPGILCDAWLGARTYRRIGDHRIHKVVLCLLGVSGLTLIWPSIVGK